MAKNKKRSKTVNKKRSKTSTLARAKGVCAEKGYVERLKKQLDADALVFQAGDTLGSGVPDIVAFSHGKVSFHEVKSRTDLLKQTQEKWIKKNCFGKRRKACIVFYNTTNRGYFRYRSITLRMNSIKSYCLSASKSQQGKTKRRIQKWKNSHFT